MNTNNTTYTLLADNEIIWVGTSKPKQTVVDFVCRSLERLGWNGTTLELRLNSEFVVFVSPSYL